MISIHTVVYLDTTDSKFKRLLGWLCDEVKRSHSLILGDQPEKGAENLAFHEVMKRPPLLSVTTCT